MNLGLNNNPLNQMTEQREFIDTSKDIRGPGYLSTENCPNPEQCKIKSHDHVKLSTGGSKETTPKKVTGRLFGENEIFGGKNHLYENCVNPD